MISLMVFKNSGKKNVLFYHIFLKNWFLPFFLNLWLPTHFSKEKLLVCKVPTWSVEWYGTNKYRVLYVQDKIQCEET